MFDFWSIVRRFLYMLFVLWIVATIIFFMFRLMPGSPLTAFIGTTFTDEQHDLLVKRFGLDKSSGSSDLLSGDISLENGLTSPNGLLSSWEIFGIVSIVLTCFSSAAREAEKEDE